MASWLCAQDVPAHIRAQVFAPDGGQFLDVGAVLCGDAGSFPCLNDTKAGKLHGAGKASHAAEFGDGAIQGDQGVLFHASIIDRKTINNRNTIYSIRGMTIHKRIRRGREAMKLTAQDFADRLGVTRGAVQQWEREGGTAPSRRHQAAVAALLGITVPELMNPELNPGEAVPATPAQPEPERSMSENAKVLAELYDMLPDDIIKRTEAYNAATAEIIAVIQGRPRQHSRAPSDTPDRQTRSEKQRA